MSFFSKLFKGGSSSGGGGGGEAAPSVTHEGFTISPNPMADGNSFRLAGTITKEIGGEVKSHMLVRADIFSSRDEAVEATVRKAQRLIDEQGERIFN